MPPRMGTWPTASLSPWQGTNRSLWSRGCPWLSSLPSRTPLQCSWQVQCHMHLQHCSQARIICLAGLQ